MSDSANETVISDRLPDSDPMATPDAPSSGRVEGNLTIGQQWRGLLIEAAWPAGGTRAFVAEHLGLMKKVVVRVSPIVESTEWRRGAWDRLCALPDVQTIRCISAEEESGWRYEVSALPPPMTLQEWLACHRPGFSEIEALVRQLAATLGVLHAQGVVHLNIRPDVIHIDESGPEPVFLLGGLQAATLYAQPTLMPSDVDPFYAPPEAAGLARHAPGPRLCAWDWWSTGRVVQEFLLGRHVLGLVLDRDVSRVTPELRSRAELLLLEGEPAGVRAGALEYMSLEAGLTPLLRGLLTGSCEARWGLNAVQRWLRHEPVQDHYDLPRSARLWVLNGRGFTLAEAAEYFTQAEHWDEGEDMLFQIERPETLAFFLQDSPAHRPDSERLQAVCDLTETAAWGEVPVIARRTVTAALAWLALANGSGVRTTLRMRGQSVDVAGLVELLRALGPAAGVAIFTALVTPAVINFVEPFDAPAARVLKAIATKGGEAIQHGRQHGWLDPHDNDGHARIFELALKVGALLRERIDLLRSLYATNSNATLAALLADKSPGPRDTVILGFTAESPERHGYITHQAWRRQRHTAFRVEAEQLTTSLFWVRLQRLLALTRVWGAPTPLFAGAVLVLTAAAIWLSRSAAPAATIASVLLLSRVYFWSRVRGMVRKFDPVAAAWVWGDGLTRSMKEADQARLRHKLHPSELTRELTRLRMAMAEVSKPTKDTPAIAMPEWWDLWLALAGAVLATLAIFVLLIAKQSPPSWHVALPTSSARAHVALTPNPSQQPTPTPPTVRTLEPAIDAAALLATGRYEMIDDGFGRQLRGPLRPWTFFSTGTVRPVEIVAIASASPEQSAFALVSGTVLLQPYSRQGVRVLLAVRVPTTRGFGFVIFNTRDRQLVDDEVLLVREPLEDHTWYQFGRRRIVYLGTPPALQSEISLAPR
jgi:hypothetical protein